MAEEAGRARRSATSRCLRSPPTRWMPKFPLPASGVLKEIKVAEGATVRSTPWSASSTKPAQPCRFSGGACRRCQRPREPVLPPAGAKRRCSAPGKRKARFPPICAIVPGSKTQPSQRRKRSPGKPKRSSSSPEEGGEGEERRIALAAGAPSGPRAQGRSAPSPRHRPGRPHHQGRHPALHRAASGRRSPPAAPAARCRRLRCCRRLRRRCSATAAPAARRASPAGVPVPDEIVPMTPMRKKIAERMVESKRTSAHVHSVFEVDMTRIVEPARTPEGRFRAPHRFQADLHAVLLPRRHSRASGSSLSSTLRSKAKTSTITAMSTWASPSRSIGD